MRFLLFLGLCISLLGLSSCEKQTEKDRELILEYIDNNNLDAVEGEDGLFYVIETEGTGANPDINSVIELHYEGFLLNGDKFDSSIDRGAPAEFPLAQLIRGWQLGLPYFKEGGSGKLILPSHLGYGRNGSSGIPPNSVLVFDIQLLDVR